MYQNDLAAAHSRIRALELELNAKASSRPDPPNQQAPPQKRKKRAGRSRFPIYYQRPASYWPLFRHFAHAVRTVDLSFPYSRPRTDSVLSWVAGIAAWPLMRLVLPVLSAFLVFVVAIPLILVSLVPLSIGLIPVALLAGLKLSSVKPQPRHALWTGRAKPMPLWEQFINYGIFTNMGLLFVLGFVVAISCGPS